MRCSGARRTVVLWAALAAALVTAPACGQKDAPTITKDSDKPAPPAAVRGKATIVTAKPGSNVQETVREELSRAKADGKRLLVYVGAPWCEPCTRFHEAVLKGELDQAFGDVRFLEYDLDEDKDNLAKAGYASKMIPLFAVPRADGTGSGEQIEGSIKGSGAVDNISPRLQALISKTR